MKVTFVSNIDESWRQVKSEIETEGTQLTMTHWKWSRLSTIWTTMRTASLNGAQCRWLEKKGKPEFHRECKLANALVQFQTETKRKRWQRMIACRLEGKNIQKTENQQFQRREVERWVRFGFVIRKKAEETKKCVWSILRITWNSKKRKICVVHWSTDKLTLTELHWQSVSQRNSFLSLSLAPYS